MYITDPPLYIQKEFPEWNGINIENYSQKQDAGKIHLRKALYVNATHS